MYFDAYFNLGIIYGNMGELDKAIQYFSRAISIKETAEVYLKRSLAYRLKGDSEKATKDLLKAKELGIASQLEDK